MSWEEDHRALWDAINEQKQELAQHTGACDVRYSEIVRRQEESMRDRHGMNLKIDGVLEKLNSAQIKMLLSVICGAGAALMAVINIVVSFLMKGHP